MTQLKAITIWQPYASLIIAGIKRFETRSWSTNYRGPLVIHAAIRWDRLRTVDCLRAVIAVRELFWLQNLTDDQLRILNIPWVDTLGCALGVVDLTNCQGMTSGGSAFEDAVGHFGPDRYGWECSNPRAFKTPFKVSGQQGLWTPGLRIREHVFNLINQPIEGTPHASNSIQTEKK